MPNLFTTVRTGHLVSSRTTRRGRLHPHQELRSSIGVAGFLPVIERFMMDDALQQAWNTIAVFVPKLVAFLLILVIGLIIARVLAKALNAVLERVGFDRAVERGGVKKALAQSKYDASDVIAKLIYYTLMLFVLQ